MSIFNTALTRRGFVVGAAASSLAAVGVPAAQAADLTKVTLALDWYPNANHAGIFMAKAKGYFEQAGLDVEVFTPADPTTVLQTVGAGRDTFGITYQSDVLQARGQGVKVKGIAGLVQHPLNCIMVLQKSGITDPTGLKGKTIGITGTPSDELIVKTVLEHVGLTMKDVELVNVGYDLMPAVLSGKADAVVGVYWTHETILAEEQGESVTYFRVEEFGVPDYYELVLVAGEDVIAKQEATVTALLGALRRGYDDAMADLDGALEILLKESKDLKQDVERKGLDLLAPMWTDNGAVPWGTMTVDRWTAYADWQKANGGLDASVDPAEAIRTDLFPVTSATPMASPAATPKS